MSTLKQIEEAIQTLSFRDREQLVLDLPALIPELNGDTIWNRILTNPSPRQGLTSMLNEVDTAYLKNPKAFPELKESDFDEKP